VDAGDGFGFDKGDYALVTFTAEKNNDTVIVRVSKVEGKRNISKEINKITVDLLLKGKKYTATGTLKDGILVALK
jgi:alpha-glucosidase